MARYQYSTKEAFEAATAQVMGYLLDAYDMVLVLAAAPIIMYVFLPRTIPPWLALIDTFLGYSITLIFRPIGSLVFGHFADKIGRRDILLVTLSGLGVSGALMAALPTYAQVGLLAYALYNVVRAAVGFFAGGEYAAGFPFAMEYVSPKIRGLVGGFVEGGFGLGAFLSGIAVAGFLAIFKEAMYTIGWRYLFLTEIVPLFVGLIIRFGMKETPLFSEIKEKGQVERMPIRALFTRPYLRLYLIVLLFTTGSMLVYYSTIGMGITAVLSQASVSESIMSFAYALAGLTFFWMNVILGFISDFIGRRKMYIITSILGIVFIVPVFYGLYIVGLMRVATEIYALSILLGIVNCFAWGPMPAFVTERFPTKIRAVGSGFGFSSSLFIGSWVPLYILALTAISKLMWINYSVMTIIGFILFLAGIILTEERTGIDLREIQ